MSIYNDSRIPYFYIIRHIQSGLMYAGAKWAEDANPENFMKPDGYQTSSNKIKSLIETDGLDSFEILRIDTNCDGIPVNIYEKSFLEINNCAKSGLWYNGHNNSILSYGTQEFSKIMIKLYGVSHNSYMKSTIVKRKLFYSIPENITKTNLKISKTVKDKYGVDWVSSADWFKRKVKESNLTNYGVENISQLDSVKLKKIDTCLTNYGVEHPMQSVKVREKSKETSIIKYGTEYPCQSDIVKQHSRETNFLVRGVEYPMQSIEVKEKQRKTNLEKYGYPSTFAYINSIERTCPHCNKTGKGNNMLRYHFDKCKLLINLDI